MFALALLLSFAAALTVASWFKNLDGSLWRESPTPVITGLIAGFAIRALSASPAVIGVILTAAMLYVRLTGRESEPSDGMSHGALLGAAAAVALLMRSDDDLIGLASCLLAGAVAGYGITFGLTHVTDKLRQALVDLLTGAIAIGAAWLPLLLSRSELTDRQIATGAVVTVPLLLLITVFRQWPLVRTELRDEARLGVIDDSDVRGTAHPFLRIGRGGWHDPAAHREFVRTATKVALRKRQQRGRAEEIARLYQLEVIKLRMQLQEMSRIDRAMRMAETRAAQQR